MEMGWYLGRWLLGGYWGIRVLSWVSRRPLGPRDFRLSRQLGVQALAISLQMPFVSHLIYLILRHPLPHTHQPFSIFLFSVRFGFDILKKRWHFLWSVATPVPTKPKRSLAPTTTSRLKVGKSQCFVLLSTQLTVARNGVSSEFVPFRLEE